MVLVKWTDEYSVGITEIDNQHKGLVIIINELFELMSAGKAKAKMNEIFDHLTDYTKKHFYTEELMLIKYAYKGLDEHKEEHKLFIEKLNGLKTDLKQGDITISLKTLNFLKDWLLNHILISDKKYSTYMEEFSE